MAIRYISAGAGSGKTYRVTTEVARLVKEGTLRPDQVIMTTFTKAAAQELREKTRQELVKLGLHKEAQQIEHALIGTVHSIANTFLTKYWYLLGIMPDASSLEDEDVEAYRNHSLKGLLTPTERQFMYGYCERNNVVDRKSKPLYEFWKSDLCNILDYMQWYKITDEQLDVSIDITDSIIDSLVIDSETLQKTAKALISEVLTALSEKRSSPKIKKEQAWCESVWNRSLTDEELSYLCVIGKDRCKDSPNTNLLSAKDHFTAGHQADHREYVRILFEKAKSWRKSYKEYKDAHHLIDFNDMEELFLELLSIEEVRSDIKSRYTHLFVDEFQDSNPMQVSLFSRLSELLDTCYVGDKKQAIYRFRGSDTELTSAVADSIANNTPLEYSYRSSEPLVKFSNAIFTRVFSSMPAREVELRMPLENGNTHIHPAPLRLCSWKTNEELARYIQQFILIEQAHGLQPKDIAVLARYNEELDDLATALRVLDVPVCREAPDIMESRVGRLMKSLLTLVLKPHNQLARAEVAYLTQPGMHITRIIEERLDNLSGGEARDFMSDVPLLERLHSLTHFGQADEQCTRNLLACQSISSLVETLVIELDLYGLVQSWADAQAEESNLQAFVDMARKYEDSSIKLARPATVNGFVNYFSKGQRKGTASDEGVRLYTYHKSKGLEWKAVIMLSLDNDPSDDVEIATKEMLGCHSHRDVPPTADNINPPMYISLVRSIYGKKTNAVKFGLPFILKRHPLWDRVKASFLGESARLLYVGVTRARDILVLAPKEGSLAWFNALQSIPCNAIPPVGTEADLFNTGSSFLIEEAPSIPARLELPTERPTHDIKVNYSFLDHPRDVSPSKVGRSMHDIRVLYADGVRMPVTYEAHQDATMGTFIHQVFCCMDDGIGKEQIEQLRASYGFDERNLPRPEMLIGAWDVLVNQLTTLYGASVARYHERPFRHFDEQGRVVVGDIDLIWETAKGYVIVDYKTFPGKVGDVLDPANKHYAGYYGDQLDCYRHALEALGTKPVLARVIYYPVTQHIIEVK